MWVITRARVSTLALLFIIKLFNMFAVFKESEGFTQSGWGTISEVFDYIDFENGNMLLKSRENGKYIEVSPQDFLNGIEQNEFVLSLNNRMPKEQVVNYINNLK